MAAPGKLTIDTPEQIALEYQIAAAGSRFMALAVDTGVQLLLLLALGLAMVAGGALRATGDEGLGTWLQALAVLVAFAVYYGYFAFFEARWSGQTPGKRLVGLRVLTISGRPIRAFDAILRNLLRIVDQLPVIYAVGIISVFVTRRHQRLGDLAAGTVVVYEQQMPTQMLTPPAIEATSGGRARASRLSPDEVEAIEAFLDRREQLPMSTRDRMAHELATHVRERLAMAPGGQTDEALLEHLAAEYRAGGRTR